MRSVHDEQTKLIATAPNSIAAAPVVIGVVTPVTAISLEIPNAPPMKGGTAPFASIWLSAGIGLPSPARRAYRGLRP